MLARSWLVLAHVGVMLRILGSKMAAKMAILGIKNAKMSQDGAQEAAKLSQDGILGSEFEVWRDLGRSLGARKPFRMMLARIWPVLAHVGVMLRILNSKVPAKMAILAIKSAKMSQDGAQEAAKLSQDGILGSRFEAFISILVSFWMPFR